MFLLLSLFISCASETWAECECSGADMVALGEDLGNGSLRDYEDCSNVEFGSASSFTQEEADRIAAFSCCPISEDNTLDESADCSCSCELTKY